MPNSSIGFSPEQKTFKHLDDDTSLLVQPQHRIERLIDT